MLHTAFACLVCYFVQQKMKSFSQFSARNSVGSKPFFERLRKEFDSVATKRVFPDWSAPECRKRLLLTVRSMTSLSKMESCLPVFVPGPICRFVSTLPSFCIVVVDVGMHYPTRGTNVPDNIHSKQKFPKSKQLAPSF